MTIIDTHSHIYQPDFDDDIDAVIERAKSAGVSRILLPNVDVESIDRLHKLSDAFSGYCLPMMGLHPTSVTAGWKDDLKFVKQQFETRRYVAVGEIGVDLYWDISLKEEQMLVFEEQLGWSIELGLPVSIHSRDAVSETISCIKHVGASKLRGVFHSFGGNEVELQEVLSLGNFYIGINGVVTFKNSALPLLLGQVDLSRIIIETDAPYLAPAPYRGKRNEPSYTSFIINKLSEIYETHPEEISRITTANAVALFGEK